MNIQQEVDIVLGDLLAQDFVIEQAQSKRTFTVCNLKTQMRADVTIRPMAYADQQECKDRMRQAKSTY